jgi:hypothetical protein
VKKLISSWKVSIPPYYLKNKFYEESEFF